MVPVARPATIAIHCREKRGPWTAAPKGWPSAAGWPSGKCGVQGRATCIATQNDAVAAFSTGKTRACPQGAEQHEDLQVFRAKPVARSVQYAAVPPASDRSRELATSAWGKSVAPWL